MSAPVTRTPLGLGVELINRTVFKDDRGTFSELWNVDQFNLAGLDFGIAQVCHSSSRKGILRGLHFQFPYQRKLITVLSGRTFSVAVDVRPDSPTLGQYRSTELDGEQSTALLVPSGFAHGFLALEDTVMCYFCDQVHQPDSEFTVRWDDPQFGIDWPLESEPILSARDQAAKLFHELDLTAESRVQ